MAEQLARIEQRELAAIASRIKGREDTIEQLRSRTFESAGATVSEAILQGQDLILAKSKVPHGAWNDWLASHCPNVSVRAAQKYMQVARNAPLISDQPSLKRALALLSPPQDKSQPALRCPEYLHLLYLVSRTAKFAARHSLDDCPDETREEIKRELEPVAAKLWPTKIRVGENENP